MANEGAAARPGGLTTICVIAIVLGTMGVCCGAWSLGSVAFQGPMQAANRQRAEAQSDPALRQQQLEMQDTLNGFTRKWMPVTTSFAFLGLIASILVLAGGALAISSKPGGRTLLLAVTTVGIPFELVRNVVDGYIGWETQKLIAHSLERTMQTVAAEHGGTASPMMGAAMGVGGALGLALVGGWGLAKIAYYAVTFFYLRKPEIRALYG